MRTTPAAGLTFKLTPDVSVYGNVGRGFETPTFAELAYRADGTTGLNFALRPAISVHREVGVKSRLGDSMRLNLAVYRIDVTDEIVVNTNAGGRSTFKNASKTKREGLELAWDGRFSHGLEAALAYTLPRRPFTAAVYHRHQHPVDPGDRQRGQPAARACRRRLSTANSCGATRRWVSTPASKPGTTARST